MSGFAEMGKGGVNSDCLEKAQVKKGPGEVVAVVTCALSDLRDEAVLGLEWVVLLPNPSVAPKQLCNPWLRPRLSTGTGAELSHGLL